MEEEKQVAEEGEEEENVTECEVEQGLTKYNYDEKEEFL